jgi:hypothetical protein
MHRRFDGSLGWAFESDDGLIFINRSRCLYVYRLGLSMNFYIRARCAAACMLRRRWHHHALNADPLPPAFDAWRAQS